MPISPEDVVKLMPLGGIPASGYGISSKEGYRVSKGIELITAERKRQIEVDGWTAKHDAQHYDGELALAAASYAAGIPVYRERHSCIAGDIRLPIITMVHLWPWATERYKPKDRLSDLVRAGALIAAEIDRLLAERAGGPDAG